MKMNFKYYAILFLSFNIFVIACNGKTSGDEKTMTAQQIVEDMGIGINLGNTFEATDSDIGDVGSWQVKTVNGFETAWGSPTITEEIIAGYAEAGFKTLRIPVAWTNLMSEDGSYTVSAAYLNRVKQVVDWALSCNMYVIINEHWDYGWISKTGSYDSAQSKFKNEDEIIKKYTAIWTQVSEAFKDYSHYLVFESQNEELGGFKDDNNKDVWNSYLASDIKNKQLVYGFANKINQTFVDTVRASGGKNSDRLLYISGIGTDIEKTCDPLFKMPADPANLMAVSVHYYEPPLFAILEEDASWGKVAVTWEGNSKDIATLEKKVQLMKTNFVDKGIPVIVGEYGCPRAYKKADGTKARKQNTDLFLATVCEKFYKAGMCPVLWDTTTNNIEEENTPEFNPCMLYNRRTASVNEKALMDKLNQIVAEGR